MLKFYPSFDHIMNEFKYVGGNLTGLMHGVIAPMVHMPPEPNLKSMTGRMPHYHKETFNDPEKNVEYHLSGYGIFNEEAMIRLMGESVERYAPIGVEKLFRDRVEYASYKEISKKGRTMPLEYLNIFAPE